MDILIREKMRNHESRRWSKAFIEKIVIQFVKYKLSENASYKLKDWVKDNWDNDNSEVVSKASIEGQCPSFFILLYKLDTLF